MRRHVTPRLGGVAIPNSKGRGRWLLGFLLVGVCQLAASAAALAQAPAPPAAATPKPAAKPRPKVVVIDNPPAEGTARPAAKPMAKPPLRPAGPAKAAGPAKPAGEVSAMPADAGTAKLAGEAPAKPVAKAPARPAGLGATKAAGGTPARPPALGSGRATVAQSTSSFPADPPPAAGSAASGAAAAGQGQGQDAQQRREVESALDQLTARPQPPPAQQAMTPALPRPRAQSPAWLGKDGKPCCTSGVDCPCTPGVDCPCTPGKDCICTPGKDCPCTAGKDCPARPPQRSDFCTPGKDCPCSGDNCKRCTPGVDCPCTPFVNCPEDKGLLFEQNSADLSEDVKGKLKRVVEEFNRHPDQKVRIEGHASDDEQARVPRAQVALSIRRANAVKQALLDAGLPPERIDTSLGWGSLCRMSVAAADSRNRRVQFIDANEQTLCASHEGKIRLPVPPPKKGRPTGKGGGTRPVGAKTGTPGTPAQRPAAPPQ